MYGVNARVRVNHLMLWFTVQLVELLVLMLFQFLRKLNGATLNI